MYGVESESGESCHGRVEAGKVDDDSNECDDKTMTRERFPQPCSYLYTGSSTEVTRRELWPKQTGKVISEGTVPVTESFLIGNSIG
jgi:hypothetical protein